MGVGEGKLVLVTGPTPAISHVQRESEDHASSGHITTNQNRLPDSGCASRNTPRQSGRAGLPAFKIALFFSLFGVDATG